MNPSEVERRLSALINALPVLLWEIDEAGLITVSEGRGLAAIGLKPQELVGQNLYTLYKDHPEYHLHHRRALAGEEFSVIVAAGQTWLESTYSPRRDESGRIVGVVGVAVDVGERVRMENAVKGLSRRLWSILEEERRRVAHELHDEAGQTMAALKLLLNRASIADDLDSARGLMNDAETLCESVLDELRRISFDLRPGSLEVLGLLPSLYALVKRFMRGTGIDARMEAPASLPPIDPDVEAAVYRFVQESLTNVTRHAQAKHVIVKLATSGERLSIEVHDDGIGFLVSRALTGTGLGLIGLTERARMLGGSLMIDSVPGTWTQIRLDLPQMAPPLVDV